MIRLTDRINEEKRKQENEDIKQDLLNRVIDWQGLNPDQFGDLLLSDKFIMPKPMVGPRTYHLYLFENYLVCCKELSKKKRRSTTSILFNSSGFNSNPTLNYSTGALFALKGSIQVSLLHSIVNTSVEEEQQFGLEVNWMDGPHTMEVFALKCMNIEQVNRWKDRLDKYVVGETLCDEEGFGLLSSSTPSTTASQTSSSIETVVGLAPLVTIRRNRVMSIDLALTAPLSPPFVSPLDMLGVIKGGCGTLEYRNSPLPSTCTYLGDLNDEVIPLSIMDDNGEDGGRSASPLPDLDTVSINESDVTFHATEKIFVTCHFENHIFSIPLATHSLDEYQQAPVTYLKSQLQQRLTQEFGVKMDKLLDFFRCDEDGDFVSIHDHDHSSNSWNYLKDIYIF